LLALGAALACGRREAPAVVTAPRLAETRDTVVELIEQWRAKMPVVGVSVALVADGEVAWTLGDGAADVEAGRAASEATVYGIGSLTKPITALAVLRAAADGVMDLDAPLRRYVAEVRGEATIRQVLAHRSGLVSDWFGGSMGDGPDWRAMVSEIAGEPEVAPPGTWTAYSNVGYTLLGLALERACGEGFEEVVAAALRATIGANGFNFAAPADVAGSYWGRLRQAEPRLRMAPAAGLYASVSDLAGFIKWLLAGDELAASMLAPQAAGPLDFDERWGLGLALRHVGLDHAGRVAWHAGRTLCHRSAVCVLPDHGLGVVVLANAREAEGVEELAISALQTALLERHGVDLPRGVGDAEVTAGMMDAGELRRHVGRYATDHDVVALTVEDGRLMSRSEVGATVPAPGPDGGFVSAGNRDARVHMREVAGFHALTSVVRGVETRVGVRCPEGHVPEDWSRRVGVYRVEVGPGEVAAFTTVQLERVGEAVALRTELAHPSGSKISLGRYVLAPVDAGEARVFGVGRGKGQRVLAEDGPDGPVLRWAGYRMVRADRA
jgi:CubicO group peptidase (beta-lactamase class C family)